MKSAIQTLMRDFSTEITPGAAAKIDDFRDYLRVGTVVYITFLPGADFADTITIAARLAKQGFIPVPHVAARSITDATALNEYLAAATAVGVERVLCIAGAVTTPVGAFTDSMQLLDTGLFDKHGIRSIALAGHPENSPDMSPQAIMAALQWKAAFAARTEAKLHLVTQFVFTAAPVIDWVQALRTAELPFAVHVGIPGLATLKTLLRHAKACGIGASMKFLTRQAKNVTQLLRVSTPDQLVRGLAAVPPAAIPPAIVGLHIYPLGGLRRSAAWAYAVGDGQFELDARDGFMMTVDIDEPPRA